MNMKYFELSKDKQMRIINAGMEVFGQYGYKKGNTDDIATKAGISKGLLFHYFENKKSFYIYLFDFCEKLMRKHVCYDEIKDIEDFFDLLQYGSQKKLLLIKQYPFLVDFILNAYLSQKETVTPEINQRITKIIDSVFDNYFQYVDMSKFKDYINPQQLYQMLIWMADGYLLNKKRCGEHFDVDEMMIEFDSWIKMLKMMSYKEEYL